MKERLALANRGKVIKSEGETANGNAKKVIESEGEVGHGKMRVTYRK